MNLTHVDLPFLRPDNTAGKRISLVLALAVHLLLAALLIYGVRWQTKAPDAVEVELVLATPQPVEVTPPPAVEPPPPPKPVLKPEPKPEPKPESKPTPVKPDIALKEKPKPPVKEEPKKKPEPKAEPKAEPKPEPKEEPDPMLEALERESRQLARKKETENMAKELTELKARQASAARNKAVADYLARIRGKIRGNIVLPPEIKGNPEAVFDVTQLPSGEIIAVRLKRSSGINALDAAIERAILKSSPLPKPEQAGLFERALELRFRPLDD
jgi:colicin import membrane protein